MVQDDDLDVEDMEEEETSSPHPSSETETVGATAANFGAAAATKSTNRRSGSNRANGRLVDGKCRIHAKYGAETYNCANPAECSMKRQVKAKPKVADIKDENNNE